MRGLRKRESLKFERFFEIVQKTAEKQNCVFFTDAGDGNDFETDEMEGETLMGWLIPQKFAHQFEPSWITGIEMPTKWDSFYCWAEWQLNNGEIEILFNQYD